MHGVGKPGLVLERDTNQITDLGSQDWAKETQVRPFQGNWLRSRERRIFILGIPCFDVFGTNPVIAGTIQENRTQTTRRVNRSIIPFHFLCRNKIFSNSAWAAKDMGGRQNHHHINSSHKKAVA